MNPSIDIVKQLWEYVQKHPKSANQIGKDIGIQHSTVLLLLRGQKNIQFETRLKIEKFLKEKLDEID